MRGDLQARKAAGAATAQSVAAMGVKELKSFLGERGVDFSGCCEKSELVTLAERTLARSECFHLLPCPLTVPCLSAGCGACLHTSAANLV